MTKRFQRPAPIGIASRLPPINRSALDTPEKVVDFCREKGLINGDGAMDIENLIESDENLLLRREDLGDKDASIRPLGKRFVISVNRRHAKSRQRFSMAHEYAHYQLHRHEIANMPDGEKILFRDGRSLPMEWQANSFAAAILMPRQSVVQAMSLANNDHIEASKRLGVSLAAFEYRLEELGYAG